MAKGFKITCLKCGEDNIEGTIIIIADSDEYNSTVELECTNCGNISEIHCH